MTIICYYIPHLTSYAIKFLSAHLFTYFLLCTGALHPYPSCYTDAEAVPVLTHIATYKDFLRIGSGATACINANGLINPNESNIKPM